MLSTAYLCLSLIMIGFEVLRKKNHVFDFLTLFNIIYWFLYPVPAFLLTSNIGNLNSILVTDSTDYTGNIQTPIAIFAGYIFRNFRVLFQVITTSGKKYLN